MPRRAALSTLLLTLAALSLSAREADSPVRGTGPEATLPGLGESTLETGDHIIHFHAFTTDQLTPAVAREYGIVSSQRRTLTNVSVLHPRASEPATPVKASVASNTSNLSRQRNSLEFGEIIDNNGTGIYYIADTPVTSGETLMFELAVTPAESGRTHHLKSRRRFEF
jgi:hypothetical protein